MPKKGRTNCPVHGKGVRTEDRSGHCEPCQYDKPITKEEDGLVSILLKWLMPEKGDKQ